MNAIEMFAGIGGFRVGLERAGINVVWANDIEPKACAIYGQHFGQDSIICGDIKDVKGSVPKHDLLTAGFPCQPFSAAGKKLGVRDIVRGTLFAEIVDVLRTGKECSSLDEETAHTFYPVAHRHLLQSTPFYFWKENSASTQIFFLP
jgi:DNA-cytosine methyltransferase